MREDSNIEQPGPERKILLRQHRSGDIGWIIQRHGELYWEEYRWNTDFERIVAEIGADFLKYYDPTRERCWIAEVDGRRAGSVMLIRHRERPGVAKLRVLLVEPWARGLGLGRRLVHECTLFAREARYDRITLWTNTLLTAARRLYEYEGYELVGTQPHNNYGHKMTAEIWELEL